MFENQTQESCEAARELLNKMISHIQEIQSAPGTLGKPDYYLGLKHAVDVIRCEADLAWLNLATPESGDAPARHDWDAEAVQTGLDYAGLPESDPR